MKKEASLKLSFARSNQKDGVSILTIESQRMVWYRTNNFSPPQHRI